MVEARPEHVLVEGELGRRGEGRLQIHELLVLVDVQHPVDVVDVVVEEVVAGVDGHDRLERRRPTHRHVDRVEPSP